MRGLAACFMATLALSAPLAAHAAETETQRGACDPIRDLRTGVAPRLMTVAVGGGRLHFLKTAEEAKGCPAVGASCAEKIYLTTGDSVVVGHVARPYACVAFLGLRPHFRAIYAFLPLRALTETQPSAEPPWDGDWRSADDREVKIDGAPEDRLSLDVVSTFPHHPAGTGDAPPEYLASAKPVRNRLAFSLDLSASDPNATGPFAADPGNAGLCRAAFWRLGPYLVAADKNCFAPGGVTATGIYRRAD